MSIAWSRVEIGERISDIRKQVGHQSTMLHKLCRVQYDRLKMCETE